MTARMPRVLTFPFCASKVIGLSVVLVFAPLALPQSAPSTQGLDDLEPARQHSSAAAAHAPTIQPTAPENTSQTARTSPSLLLGPGDELEVTVYGAPDLSGHTRINENGNISMPLIGYVRLAGLSTSEAETAIEAQLRQNNIINDPQVSIYAKDFTSSGISVAGEVSKPGVYSVLGPHRLFDVLQLAGGITERASNTITISHRGEPESTTLTISKNPAEMGGNNVELRPGDTVVIPKAGIVYVLGEVTRPGGYVLNSSGGVTVLQVVAAAGGPTHLAAYGKTTLLHRTPTGLQEQKLDLKKLLHGKQADIPLKVEEIVYVPTSGLKTTVNAGTLIGAAGTAALYHLPY
jgi:polysaccharide export outer membrane protein